MSRPDRTIVLVDLDHVPADEHRSLVRVRARLAVELGRPAEAELLVSRWDAAWLSFPARAWTQESPGIWRGVFAVPSAIVERAEFGFALHTAGHTTPLPHPGFGIAASAAPEVLDLPIFSGAFTPVPHELTAEHVTRLTGGRLRTRAVALATLLAVTTASTPALALAAQVIEVVPTGHAQATRERIEQLAVFAAERARVQAARKRTRARATSRNSASARRASAGTATSLQGGLAGHTSKATGAATKRPTTSTGPAPARGGHHSVSSSPAGAPDCVHPKAVIAVTTSAARKAHALALAIHCGTLGRTVTSTPAAPSTNPTPTTPAQTTPSLPTTPVTPAPPVTATTPSAPTTPAAPTTTTTATTPAVPTTGAGALGTGTVPAPAATTPTPTPTPTAPGTLSPTAPPRLASSGRERASRPQLPVTFPSSKGDAGRSRHHHAGHAQLGSHPHRVSGGSAVTLTPSPPGFLGPKSWTGTVVNDPSLQSLLGNLSAVLHDINRPPRFLIPIYMEASRRYGVPWPVLAAINSVETDYGRNLNTSSAGAIGWMQFEPSTWKEWGVAVDGHSVANPYDPRDAIFSAARYLAAAGAGADISRAIYAYNHAGWYVNMVLARARAIGAGISPHTQTNGRGIITTFFDQSRGRWRAPYRGGYLTHFTRLVASANMVSAADFPYLWGGGHEQPARFGAFDCSGSVSYVLQQAGYRVPTSTSGNVPRWHFPAGPGRVTIFYNTTHTFMRIGHRYFGTSTSRPGGGAGWIGTDRLPTSYLANFNEVHVPGLRGDAFAAARRRAAERRAAHATHPTPLRLIPLPAQTSAKLQLTFPST